MANWGPVSGGAMRSDAQQVPKRDDAVHLKRAARHPLGHGDHCIPRADEAQVQEGIIPQHCRGAPVSHWGLGELGGWVGEEAQGWEAVEALNHSAHGRRQYVVGLHVVASTVEAPSGGA